MKKFDIIIIFIIIFPLTVFSQNRVAVTITDYSNKETSWENEKKNIIKTSPFSFISGRQYLNYERGFNKLISVQATMGLTFEPFVPTRSVGRINFDQQELGVSCTFFDINGGGCQNFNDFSYRRFTAGFIGGLSVRFFFEQEFLNGFYVGLSSHYTQYNNDVQRIEDGNSHLIRLENSWDKEKFRFKDLVVRGGYQYVTKFIVLEAFAGIGVRAENNQFQAPVKNNSNWSNRIVEVKDRSILTELSGTIGFRF